MHCDTAGREWYSGWLVHDDPEFSQEGSETNPSNTFDDEVDTSFNEDGFAGTDGGVEEVEVSGLEGGDQVSE